MTIVPGLCRAGRTRSVIHDKGRRQAELINSESKCWSENSHDRSEINKQEASRFSEGWAIKLLGK